MGRYVVLVAPSSNRVYAASAPTLCAAELAIVANSAVAGGIGEVATTTIASLDHLTFEAEELDGDALTALADLSGTLAVYETVGDLLRPVELHRRRMLDDDLTTIPKYQGKTNEQFTRLLLNVTRAAAERPAGRTEGTAVLDPLCGRGTTLDVALTYGFDVAGVEIEQREVDAYATFLRTYLERKRIKHTFDYSPLRRDGRKVGKQLTAELNADKDAFKRGERQTVTVHCADTLRTAELFGRRRFDLIVTDAPYGVSHGSRSGEQRSRNAVHLLAEAVPVWAGMLRPGGALGVAWNTLGLPRNRLGEIVAGAGLDVCDSPAYRSLEHRVDAGIVRDVLVARRLR